MVHTSKEVSILVLIIFCSHLQFAYFQKFKRLKSTIVKSQATGLRLKLIATSLLGWTVNKKLLLVMQHRHFTFLLLVKKITKGWRGKILVRIFRLGTRKLPSILFFWRVNEVNAAYVVLRTFAQMKHTDFWRKGQWTPSENLIFLGLFNSEC